MSRRSASSLRRLDDGTLGREVVGGRIRYHESIRAAAAPCRERPGSARAPVVPRPSRRSTSPSTSPPRERRSSTTRVSTRSRCASSWRSAASAPRARTRSASTGSRRRRRARGHRERTLPRSGAHHPRGPELPRLSHLRPGCPSGLRPVPTRGAVRFPAVRDSRTLSVDSRARNRHLASSTRQPDAPAGRSATPRAYSHPAAPQQLGGATATPRRHSNPATASATFLHAVEVHW